jgi:hypothetical protein
MKKLKSLLKIKFQIPRTQRESPTWIIRENQLIW